jgi:hypothetical protein
MTVRHLSAVLAIAAFTVTPALAQTSAPRTQTTPRPATAPAPPAPPAAPGEPAPPVPPPPPPRKVGQPVNIKIEVTIADQGRADAPTLKKTVSVVTGDGLNGRIRSTASYRAIGVLPLNIDAEPELLTDGKIRLRVNLQYSLPGNVGVQAPDVPNAGSLQFTEIQENLSLILESGKPIIAAQSADPVGDRQVTIEVKATVLR